MLPTLFRSLLVLVLLGALAHAEAAGRRVALVIGNSAYVSVPELDNPSNDAKAVAHQFRDFGFEVTLLLDLDKASFEARVRDFAGSLNGAEAAVFFYAGHGLQVDGRNYMVPVDANRSSVPARVARYRATLLATERITNIVILDACRNNPLSEKLAKALGERPWARALPPSRRGPARLSPSRPSPTTWRSAARAPTAPSPRPW
jgi:hypothetical protein